MRASERETSCNTGEALGPLLFSYGVYMKIPTLSWRNILLAMLAWGALVFAGAHQWQKVPTPPPVPPLGAYFGVGTTGQVQVTDTNRAIVWGTNAVVDVKGIYKAKGDGVTDDSSNFQTAATSAASLGAALLVPAGNYVINTATTFDQRLRVRIAGGVTFSGAGSASWKFFAQGAQPSWLATDWYVDPVSGSDANTGADSGHPVKTVMGGIVLRWGQINPTLPQTVTLHLMSSETVGQESIALAMLMVGNGPSLFILDGTLGMTTVASFTCGTVTAKVRGNPGTLLQVASMPGAAAQGMLIQNTTHASYAFIDSMSGSTGTITQPLSAPELITPTWIPQPTEVDTWTAGDSCVLYTLPMLNLKMLNPTGPDGSTAAGGTFSTFWVQNIWVPDASGTPSFSTFFAQPNAMGMVFSNVRMDMWLMFQGANQYIDAVAQNTWLNGCGQLQFAGAVGGALCTQSVSSGTHLFDLASLDGDLIVHGGMYVKGSTYDIMGTVYFDASITPQMAIIHGGDVQLEPSGGLASTTTALWGPGTMNLESPGSSISNESGTLWANILMMGGYSIDGVTTATSYSAGVWTDGRAITPANLDTYNGLQNPRTGARFSFN